MRRQRKAVERKAAMRKEIKANRKQSKVKKHDKNSMGFPAVKIRMHKVKKSDEVMTNREFLSHFV